MSAPSSLGPSLSGGFLLGLSSGDNPLLEKASMPNFFVQRAVLTTVPGAEAPWWFFQPLWRPAPQCCLLCIVFVPASDSTEWGHHVLNWCPAAAARGDFPALLLQTALLPVALCEPPFTRGSTCGAGRTQQL